MNDNEQLTVTENENKNITAEEILKENTEEILKNTTRVQKLQDNVTTVIRGKEEEFKLILTVLLAGGHILLEDNPGTGKTVMAKTLAHSITGEDKDSLVFRRIQFTPDLLPMDLIGLHIFDENKKDFIFNKGPLFCNVLLADEINRASPKVQSALLESMAENQITVGNTSYQLEKLFFIIATQNPIEMEGTYPLPAAQLDRFFMKINFGYVNEKAELDIYNNYTRINNNLNHLNKVLDIEDILGMQKLADETYVHPELIKSVYNIVKATREHVDIALGASPRSGIIFLKCLRAYALVCGRGFVIEDDIKQLANSVFHHRLIFRNKEGREKALNSIISKEISRLSKIQTYAPNLG